MIFIGYNPNQPFMFWDTEGEREFMRRADLWFDDSIYAASYGAELLCENRVKTLEELSEKDANLAELIKTHGLYTFYHLDGSTPSSYNEGWKPGFGEQFKIYIKYMERNFMFFRYFHTEKDARWDFVYLPIHIRMELESFWNGAPAAAFDTFSPTIKE